MTLSKKTILLPIAIILLSGCSEPSIIDENLANDVLNEHLEKVMAIEEVFASVTNASVGRLSTLTFEAVGPVYDENDIITTTKYQYGIVSWTGSGTRGFGHIGDNAFPDYTSYKLGYGRYKVTLQVQEDPNTGIKALLSYYVDFTDCRYPGQFNDLHIKFNCQDGIVSATAFSIAATPNGSYSWWVGNGYTSQDRSCWPMTVSMNGPNGLYKFELGTWTAYVQNAIGNVSYAWYKSMDGINYSSINCTSQSYTSSNTAVWLKVVVSTSAQTAQAIKYIEFLGTPGREWTP